MAKKYHQGKYTVKNPEKYIGDYTKVIYRSGWELKMFIWCDSSSNVKRWASEEVVIPYISPFDGKYHRYYTDVYAEIEQNGEILKRIYEIKPEKERHPPKKPKRRTQSYINRLRTYIINQAKWKAAGEFCEGKDVEFKILTEKELKIK